jgi:hypothetical protein
MQMSILHIDRVPLHMGAMHWAYMRHMHYLGQEVYVEHMLLQNFEWVVGRGFKSRQPNW